MTRFVCALLAAGSLLALAPVSAQTPPSLTIYGNTSTIELAPVLLAVAQFYKAPATITTGGAAALFAEPNSPTSAPGKADIATNAETQVLRLTEIHPDLKIIFTDTEAVYRLIGKRSAGIKTAADLRGKRIGTVPLGSSAYYLHRVLGTAGLTEADITPVPFETPKEISKAFMEGKLDAMTIWEPEIDIVQGALGADAIEIQPPNLYRELVNMNSTTANLNDPVKRKAIVAFVRSLIQSAAAINADPKAAQALVAQRSGYDPAVIAHAWPHHRFPGAISSDLLDVLVPEEAWLAAQEKRAPRTRAQLATIIDSSIVQEARAEK